MSSPPAVRPSLAIYLPDLSGGGAERLYLSLAPFFAEAGWAVSFLLDRRRGELLGSVPPGIAVRSLDASRQIRALPKLVRFLRQTRPDLLLTATEHMNVVAVAAAGMARRIAGTRTRVVVSQHNALSHQTRRPGLKHAALPMLYRLALPRAAGVIAVSHGVADETARLAFFPRERIDVVHNGAVRPDLDAVAAEALPEWWPPAGRRVVLAVGRMVEQKDHATLLRAFARLNAPDAALVLLGDGPLRGDLERLATELGIAERVAMPGFLANPFPAMAAADLVVLSSRFEGFGLVLAEALACGTPVVSTDCEFGPSEILDGGRFGPLVPVADPGALADAMAATLAAPLPAAELSGRGYRFTAAQCAADYLEIFRRLLPEGLDHPRRPSPAPAP